jgi:hypothetical protein
VYEVADREVDFDRLPGRRDGFRRPVDMTRRTTPGFCEGNKQFDGRCWGRGSEDRFVGRIVQQTAEPRDDAVDLIGRQRRVSQDGSRH